jgi:hypothetical protein
MLGQKDRISGGLPVQAYQWPISVTLPEDYVVSIPPVPYFSIFHPPSQGGLLASLSKHPLFHSISLVDKQTHDVIVSGIRTTVLFVD